ncbi:MAG: glycosyltransferase family 2 protein [Pseudomonadota bacterium]
MARSAARSIADPATLHEPEHASFGPHPAASGWLRRLVSVVTVSYRSADCLPDALRSIPEGVRKIVVDNAGLDNSAELAEAAGATVLRNTDNPGFGTACNQGAELVETPFVLFLNPDARISSGSLERLVAALCADPSVAAVGPLLTHHGERRLPRRKTLLDIGEEPTFAKLPAQETDVGFLSGAALLVRTELFREIGGFDERIFLYLEDDDLCFRLRAAGHRLRLITDAVVAHDQTPQAQIPARTVRDHNRYTLASMRYVAQKHRVAINFTKKRRQAWKRLCFALILMDRRRIHANFGRLQGMGAFHKPPIDRRPSEFDPRR